MGFPKSVGCQNVSKGQVRNSHDRSDQDRSIQDCKTQNGHQGAPKWLTLSGKGATPSFLVLLSTFDK